MPTTLFLCLRNASNQVSWLAHATLTCAQNADCEWICTQHIALRRTMRRACVECREYKDLYGRLQEKLAFNSIEHLDIDIDTDCVL